MMLKNDINVLHAELDNPSEVITHATGRVMGLHFTGTLNPCEDCALGIAKKKVSAKKTVHCSKILGERLFGDISSPFTTTLGGKKHWLFIMEGSTNYAWCYF